MTRKISKIDVNKILKNVHQKNQEIWNLKHISRIFISIFHLQTFFKTKNIFVNAFETFRIKISHNFATKTTKKSVLGSVH